MEEPVIQGAFPEESVWQREEKCRRSLKTVSKAIFMRLFVTGLLLWVALNSGMELWILGLLALVLLINAAGILPLITEWKKQRKILNQILAEEDA